jgi:hypothetical protein
MFDPAGGMGPRPDRATDEPPPGASVKPEPRLASIAVKTAWYYISVVEGGEALLLATAEAARSGLDGREDGGIVARGGVGWALCNYV